MHLVNQQRYKIIISDEPEEVTRGMMGINNPAMSNNDSDDDVSDDEWLAARDIRNYLDHTSSDDSLFSETESSTDDDEFDWTPPPSPGPVEFAVNEELFEDDPIGLDELHELLAVLENIVRTNPNLLNDPRPVIDLDIYKYSSFEPGSDELVWEFEYYIHEDPSHAFAAG